MVLKRGSNTFTFWASSPESILQRTRTRGIIFLVVVLLDLSCVVVLYLSKHHFRLIRAEGGWSKFWGQLTDFYGDVLDLLFLFAFRLLALPALGALGGYYGLPVRSTLLSVLAARREASEAAGDEEGLGLPVSQQPTGEPLAEPLLPAAPPQPRGKAAALTEEEIRTADAKSELWRDSCIAVAFLVCTLLQVYAGIKCIGFRFAAGASTVQGLMMGSTVAWVNLEMVLLASLVEVLTEASGTVRPDLHQHQLFFSDTKSVGHSCDLCRRRINKGYRCDICDFDCCEGCFGRKDRRVGEGGLRGDRGMRQDQDIGPYQYFLRAVKLVAPEGPLFLLAFLCLTATSAARLLLPHFQGKILDAVIAHDRSAFLWFIECQLIVSALTGLFGAVRGLCFQLVGRRLAFHVRKTLFAGILAQDIAFFDSANTGDLTSRLSYDANAMIAPCQTMLSSTVQNIYSLVGGLAMCFYVSWRLSMLAFTTILPISYITARYAKWSSNLNRQIYTALGEANTIAAEALGNIRTVRAFSTEAGEIAKYMVHLREALAAGVRDAVGGAGAFALNNLLDLGGGVLILWFGGMLVLEHEGERHALTVGKLITFQLYFNMMQAAYTALQSVVTSFTKAAGAAQRVMSLMDSLPDIDPAAGAALSGPMAGCVEFRDVWYHYQMRPDKDVLRGVTLRIAAGSVCALVGRSGGGKSTMIHLILRYYDPSRGDIALDGRPLTGLKLEEVHRQMGLVSQETQMFAKSIRENITYGCPEERCSAAQVEEAARRAHAHDFVASFPDGYETLVGERGVRLSGGQKQRIAVARAFLRQPRLLLLDEATSALDGESEALVQQSLDALIRLKESTVILVAHRLSTVVNADKIAVIDEGRIVEEGTHAELLALGEEVEGGQVRAGDEGGSDGGGGADAAGGVALARGVYARLVAKQLAKQANLLDQDGGAQE